MKSRWLLSIGGAVLVAVVVIAVLALASGKSDPVKTAMEATGNSFIAPTGAVKSMPDTWTTKPDVFTKGWRPQGAIDDACTAWREAYRNWIGAANVGAVSGSVTPGQSCTYTGPKDGNITTLLVAVYGADPEPDATLTITKP